MGVANSKRRRRKKLAATDGEVVHTDWEVSSFTESESDGEWDNLPPFPTGARTYHYLVKLLIIGDCDTGKSSLLCRYAEDIFFCTYIATIGIDFKIRTIIIDERRFKLQMWDTSGHERFRTITRTYFRGVSGIFIVYNATNEATFNALPKWINEVKENASPSVKLVLLGNKCDLKRGDKDNLEVDFHEAKKFSEEHGIPLFEVSAKDGTNVELVFAHMIARIWKTMLKQSTMS